MQSYFKRNTWYLIIGYLCLSVSIVQANYITNPSFEDTTLNVYFKTWWSGTGTFSIDSVNAKTGSKSLKIQSSSGGTATVWQVFPALPNTTYRYTGWAMTQGYNPAGGATGLEIKTGTDDTTSIYDYFSPSAAAATTWTQFTIQFATGATDTIITAIMDYGLFGSGATGNVWFDDLNVSIATTTLTLSFSRYPNGKPTFLLNGALYNPVLMTANNGTEADLINYKNAGFNMIYLPVDYNNVVRNSSLQNFLIACQNQNMPVIIELMQGSLWSWLKSNESGNMKLSPDYSTYTSYPYQYVHYFPDYMNPNTRSFHISKTELAISNLSTYYHKPIVGISIGATDAYHMPDGEYHSAFTTLYPHPKGEARQTWLPYGTYAEDSYRLYLSITSTDLSQIGFSSLSAVYAPWDIDTARNLAHWRSWFKYRQWYVTEFVNATKQAIKKYTDLPVTGTYDLNFANLEKFASPIPRFQEIFDFPIYYLYGSGVWNSTDDNRKEGYFNAFMQTARSDAWSKGKPGIAMKEFSSDSSIPSYTQTEYLDYLLPFVSGFQFQYSSEEIGGAKYAEFTTKIAQINLANSWSTRPAPANLAIYISPDDVNNWDKGFWASLLLYYLDKNWDIIYSLDSISSYPSLHIPGGQPVFNADSIAQAKVTDYIASGGQMVSDLLNLLPTSNLISNPSFESGTMSNYSQGIWTGTATIGIDTIQKHTGTYSLKISGNSASATVWQTVNGIVPSKEYVGSLWLYAPESNRGNGNTTLEWKSNGTPYWIGPDFGWNNLGWASGWTQVYYPMNSADATQFGLICAYNIYGTGTGTVWYDDLELKENFVVTGIDAWELYQ